MEPSFLSDPWAQLAAYLAGEGTSAERAAFERWVAASPERRMLVRRAREQWTRGMEPSVAEVAVAREGVVSRAVAGEPIGGGIHRARTSPVITRRRGWLGSLNGRRMAYGTIGAALVVLGGVGTTTPVPRPGERRVEGRFATRTGEQRVITLPDGTRMRLAPETQATMAPTFGHDGRVITLTGEADFDVTNVAGTPLIVRTGAVTTRVLGTRFSVRRYSADRATTVMVSSGRVSVEGRRMHATVSAGGSVRATDSTVAQASAGELGQYTDWSRGRLVFQDTPVPTLLKTLGRWYGYRFELADSALSMSAVSAVFKVADATDMFLVLKSTLNVRITVHDDVVTLFPARDRGRAPARSDVLMHPMERGK